MLAGTRGVEGKGAGRTEKLRATRRHLRTAHIPPDMADEAALAREERRLKRFYGVTAAVTVRLAPLATRRTLPF